MIFQAIWDIKISYESPMFNISEKVAQICIWVPSFKFSLCSISKESGSKLIPTNHLNTILYIYIWWQTAINASRMKEQHATEFNDALHDFILYQKYASSKYDCILGREYLF